MPRTTAFVLAEPCEQARPGLEWRGSWHEWRSGRAITLEEKRREREKPQLKKKWATAKSKKSFFFLPPHTFSPIKNTNSFVFFSFLNSMASLATFSPAQAQPGASAAARSRSRSSNLAAPLPGRAANASSVVTLVRSPKQQSCCSSSAASAASGRRSSIIVARAETAATSPLPPLAALDGKERERERCDRESERRMQSLSVRLCLLVKKRGLSERQPISSRQGLSSSRYRSYSSTKCTIEGTMCSNARLCARMPKAIKKSTTLRAPTQRPNLEALVDAGDVAFLARCLPSQT